MSIYSFLYVQLHAVTIIYNVSGYRLSQPFTAFSLYRMKEIFMQKVWQ